MGTHALDWVDFQEGFGEARKELLPFVIQEIPYSVFEDHCPMLIKETFDFSSIFQEKEVSFLDAIDHQEVEGEGEAFQEKPHISLIPFAFFAKNVWFFSKLKKKKKKKNSSRDENP